MMFPRKEVLNEVGFFINSNLGEDSDYYQRIKIRYGSDCEVLVSRTLYEALLGEEFFFFLDGQN